MGTIAIKLNPEKLENADLDLRYLIPDRIEELTKGKVQDDGYDYSSDETNSIIIFMKSENPEEDVKCVLEILRSEKFLNNDIYEVGVIAINNGQKYKVIHPEKYDGEFVVEDEY